MKEFEILSWDSSFFGVKTARVKTKHDNFELKKILEDLYDQDVELIYYNSPVRLDDFDQYQSVLLDTRVSILKELKTRRDFNEYVKIYEGKEPSEEMLHLSERIARESRYFYDPNIPKQKVFEMYEIWLNKSVTGEMATDVLVYEKDEKVLGLATIKLIDQDRGLIPLLAVASEHEGKGISFALMRAVEEYLLQKGRKFLVSETQAKNVKAIKVYERFGVECQETHHVYHLWRRQNGNIS